MNILLIDSSVKNHEVFVDSVNSNTIPIVYFPHTTRQEILDKFVAVERIAIVSYTNTTIEGESLFSDTNIDFIKTIIDTYQIKHIDFLACNTLNDPTWMDLFDKLPKSVIIGASDNKTGNLKYGGDWLMESISEDIEFIYFNDSIQYYTYLLDLTTFTGILYNQSLYVQGDFTSISPELYTLSQVSNSFSNITCGNRHTVGLKNGILHSCGSNTSGQLGNGTTTNSSTFTPMTFTPVNGETIVQIACGNNHTVVLTSIGNVYCCGNNSNGQLGRVNTRNALTLIKMSLESIGSETITQIACGANYTVVLTSTGKVYSCGSNSTAQFGNGTSSNSSTLTAMSLSNLSGNEIILQIACTTSSIATTVVRTSSDKVYSCGSNDNGQVGNGTSSPNKTSLTAMTTLPNEKIIQIACGSLYTAVLTLSGKVYSCGNNQNGQFGNNTTSISVLNATSMLLEPIGGEKITQIACGATQTLVVTSFGKVYGCGSNSNGQLGTGNTSNSTTLIPMSLGAIGSETITQITCGASHTVLLTSSEKVYGCGSNNNGQLGRGKFNNSKQLTLYSEYVKTYSFNYNNIYLIKTDNTLYGSGINVLGQLGNGNTINTTSLTAMILPSLSIDETFIQIACGQSHVVVLTSAGKVYGCGSNNVGQLGTGNTSNSTTLIPMLLGPIGSETITQIACGTNHTVIRTSAGKVYGCGSNSYGQLGTGNTSNSTLITMSLGAIVSEIITQIACGSNYTVLLTSSEKVYGCGRNSYGQLGRGNTSNAPTLIPMLLEPIGSETIRQITCGASHTVIRTSAEKVYGCGSNFYGQLGNGTTSDSTTLISMLLEPIGSKTITKIACSDYVTVAYTNASVYACGDNTSGQINSSSNNFYSYLTKIDTRTTPVDYYLDPLNTSVCTLIKPVTEYKNEYDAVAIYDITLYQAKTLLNPPAAGSGNLFGIGNLFTEALVANGKITDVDIKTALPVVGQDNIIIDYIKFVDSIVTPGNENTVPYIADLSNTKSLAQDYYILSQHIQTEVLTYSKVRSAFEEIDAALNEETFIVGDTMSSELTIKFFYNGLTHRKIYKLFFRVATLEQPKFQWVKGGNARIFNRDPTADYKVFGASIAPGIEDVFYPYDSTFEDYLDEITKQLAPQNGIEQLNYSNKVAIAGPPPNPTEEDYTGYLINEKYLYRGEGDNH